MIERWSELHHVRDTPSTWGVPRPFARPTSAVLWRLVMHDARRERRPWRGCQSQGSFPAVSGLVAAAVALFALVAGLAVHVHSTKGAPLGIDGWIYRHLAERLPSAELHQVGGTGYRLIARAGAPGFVTLTMMLTLAWAFRRRDVPGAVLAIVGPGAALVVAESVIKPLVGRANGGGGLMFPSGTVTVVTASAAVAVLLVYRWAGVTRAIIAALTLGIVPVVMFVTVVELQWHLATDAIAGLALGIALVCAVAAILAVLEGARLPSQVADLNA